MAPTLGRAARAAIRVLPPVGCGLPEQTSQLLAHRVHGGSTPAG